MALLDRFLLRFYPAEYRDLFGDEIGAVLAETAREKRAHGRVAYGVFLLNEAVGLFAGCAIDWSAKFARSSAYMSTRALAAETPAMSVDESEQRIRFLCKRMEYAIAHHDFESARFYSAEDRKERENLERLRAASC